MIAQAKRLYPIYATVIFIAFVVYGAVFCVNAKNAPESIQSTYEINSAESMKCEIVMENPRIDAPKLTETIEDPEKPPYLLDIPLSDDLQVYIYELCAEREIPYTLAIAIIEQESNYRSDTISKSNDYGLMQINIINHESLKNIIGVTDFLDPKQNCDAGIYMLANYYRKYNDEHKALMAYNLGETGAKRRWNNKIYTTAYSETVVKIMNRLEENGG